MSPAGSPTSGGWFPKGTFGARSARLHALLSLVLAAAIIVTMQVLGLTLVAAALVIPPVVARMLTNSFARMLFISTGIGAVSGFAGMFALAFLVSGARALAERALGTARAAGTG